VLVLGACQLVLTRLNGYDLRVDLGFHPMVVVREELLAGVVALQHPEVLPDGLRELAGVGIPPHRARRNVVGDLVHDARVVALVSIRLLIEKLKESLGLEVLGDLAFVLPIHVLRLQVTIFTFLYFTVKYFSTILYSWYNVFYDSS